MLVQCYNVGLMDQLDMSKTYCIARVTLIGWSPVDNIIISFLHNLLNNIFT